MVTSVSIVLIGPRGSGGWPGKATLKAKIARGGIRDIVFSPTWRLDPATALYYLPMMDQLPVMLDPGHFARFTVELQLNQRTELGDLLLAGGHAVLVTHDERHRTFLIPKPPAHTEERTTAKGRVVKH